MRRIDPIREQVERDVFTDREEVLEKLWEWAMRIPKGVAGSIALLSQRRMGKTAVLERLYNRLFWEQEAFVPIFYRVERENKLWREFAEEYYANFLAQYTAFKLKDPSILEIKPFVFEDVLPHISKLEEAEVFREDTKRFEARREREYTSHLWKYAAGAPDRLAWIMKGYMGVIIDEFQEMNLRIFRDREALDRKVPVDDLTNSYFWLCSSIGAPMLVSGSAVTILSSHVLGRAMNGRFGRTYLKPMSPEDGASLAMKLAKRYGIRVTFEVCLAISEMAGGNPYYIYCVFTSGQTPREILDLGTVEGLMEYEITGGKIKAFWDEHFEENMERIDGDKHAKRIVLYIAKHADKDVKARDVTEELGIPFEEVMKRLKLLREADIVEKISSALYRGLQDKMLMRYIQLELRDEIEQIERGKVVEDLKRDLEDEVERIGRMLKSIEGGLNYYLGRFSEIFIENVMGKFDGREVEGSHYFNIEGKVTLPRFEEVYRTRTQMIASRGYQIDVFGLAVEEGEEIGWAVEVRHREDQRFGIEDVRKFLGALESLRKERGLDRICGWVFSRAGFTDEAEVALRQEGVMVSEMEGLRGLLREFNVT